eukprot:COSAG01_NODE_2705_length_7221_cov_80.513760_6_plen_103_part_00
MRRARYLPATAPQYAYVLTNDGARTMRAHTGVGWRDHMISPHNYGGSSAGESQPVSPPRAAASHKPVISPLSPAQGEAALSACEKLGRELVSRPFHLFCAPF